MKETWWSIFTDPHHIIAELAWTLIQDVLFGLILYKIVWQKHIYPKLHAKFDREHGLDHHIDTNVEYHGGWGKKKDWL